MFKMIKATTRLSSNPQYLGRAVPSHALCTCKIISLDRVNRPKWATLYLSVVQCSKINTHSSNCMILLECLTHHLVPESSPTPSHSPKPRMRIIILFVDNPPMYIYQLGRLRRLILFVDYPPMYINWAVSDD